MDDLQERVTELEIRFSHQSHLIEELNEVVVESFRRIEALERENARFREMLGTLAPQLSESPDE